MPPFKRVTYQCETCGRERSAVPSQQRRYCSYKCRAEASRIRDPVAHFWRQVERRVGGCWHWTRAIGTHGYGVYWDGQMMWTAPRYAYHLTHGHIPVGKHVLHHCDNRPCVNPSHLFIGSNHDNILDMMAKGRCRRVGLKGTTNPQVRLTDADVRQIRSMSKTKMSARSIARHFGVSGTTINKVLNGAAWTHVT